MKNISPILSALALLLIGVLFFLFFNHTEQLKKISVAAEKQSAFNFKIAYFEMDSLEAHYAYSKDVEGKAMQKQNLMNEELNSMEKAYQRKISEWRQKGSKMSAAESEQAQQEYAEMQQNYQTRKQNLTNELYQYTEDLKSDMRKKIQNYLKEFNKQKNYSFIFAYEPSSFIYYKDTVYNITGDLVAGLNATYKKKN